MLNDYTRYTIYIVGSICVTYTLFIILQHILLYYIVNTLKKFVRFVNVTAEQYKNEMKEDEMTDREDELKRDQKFEIFKQQASEIKKAMAKKKSGGDAIEVDIERFGGETSQGSGKAFEENSPRLQAGKERERIVGVVDQASLPKWQKFVFNKMFTELSQIANIMVQNQVSSSQKGGYWTSYVQAKATQQEQSQSTGVGRKMGRGV